LSTPIRTGETLSLGCRRNGVIGTTAVDILVFEKITH